MLRPTSRLEIMPGPRVTEIKSGLRFHIRVPVFEQRMGIFLDEQSSTVLLGGSALGSEGKAETIKAARCSWWESIDCTGWIPRNLLLSAVCF